MMLAVVKSIVMAVIMMILAIVVAAGPPGWGDALFENLDPEPTRLLCSVCHMSSLLLELAKV
jgi:hypothetical protein